MGTGKEEKRLIGKSFLSSLFDFVQKGDQLLDGKLAF